MISLAEGWKYGSTRSATIRLVNNLSKMVQCGPIKDDMLKISLHSIIWRAGGLIGDAVNFLYTNLSITNVKIIKLNNNLSTIRQQDNTSKRDNEFKK
jgi:hypothetical protein